MHLIKKNSQRANKHCEFFLMRCNYSQRAANQFLPWLEKTSSPGSLTADFFIYKYKTSAFVTGKCRLKVKIAGGTCQDGVNMVYFRTCALKEKGDKFSRELDFWFISILRLYHVDHPEAGTANGKLASRLSIYGHTQAASNMRRSLYPRQVFWAVLI